MTYTTNNFPSGIQDPTSPSSTDQVATFDHAGLETFQNASIKTLKDKVGADGSAVTTSHDYKLGEVISGDKAVGKTATQTITNKTLTSPNITNKNATGTDSGIETMANKTLTSPTISAFNNANHNHEDSNGGNKLTENALNLSDNTINNSSTSKHGFLPKLSGNSNDILKGDGTFGVLTGLTKFGGSGADSDLTVTSGVTNIDLGGSQVFVKNYSSISITGTGAITFSNPHANGTTIILKSSGSVTLTSSASTQIDASGTGGRSATYNSNTLSCGRSGGALYIECKDTLTFTGTNSIKNNGLNATGSINGTAMGGVAGSILILYNTAGTITGSTQCVNGSNYSVGGGGSVLTASQTGQDGIGMYNRSPIMTSNPVLDIEWVSSSYSKYPQLVPTGGVVEASSATGFNGFSKSGGVNIVALNTEFV